MNNTYTTGTFAKMANVTERTIRYYDKIGLLKPSFVLDNGYRQYSDMDLMKLQKILSLRHLGFSIEEIFPMVVNDAPKDIEHSLQLQMNLLDKKINHLKALKDSLESIEKTFSKDKFNWDKMIELVQLTNMESDIVEQYKNATNLNVRIALHDRYSVNQQGWFPWVLDQINFTGVYRLLEIGCGNGKLWENCNVNLRNREIFLTDSSQGMIEDVREKLGKTFNCIVANCEHIPFKDNYFDAIIANHVLFYVNDMDQGLSEVKRVLKKGGIFYCSTYGKNHMKEINDIVTSFDSRIRLSETHLYDRFGLENGEYILKDYFYDINLKEYLDKLVINDSKPFVDYIMSSNGNQNEIIGTKLPKFQKYIENILIEKKSIKITKDAGLFICKK